MGRRTWRRFDDPFGTDPIPAYADPLPPAAVAPPDTSPTTETAPAAPPPEPSHAPPGGNGHAEEVPPAPLDLHDPTPEDAAAAARTFGAREPVVAGDPINRVKPRDIEAEVSVLGSILLDNSVIGPVCEETEESDFERSSHRVIFRAMIMLYDEHGKVDAVLLRDALNRMGQLEAVGGPDAIVNLLDQVPTAANAVHYAQVVRRKRRLRDAIEYADRVVRFAMSEEVSADDLLATAATDFRELAEQSARGRLPRLVGMGDLFDMDIPLPPPLIGDQQPTALFSKGQFGLFVGPPKLGKSAILQDLIEGLCRPGAEWVGQILHGPKKILLIPKEGGLALLKGRLISMASRVDRHYAQNCLVMPDADARRFRLDDRRSVSLLRRIIEENGIDIFILDPMAKFHQADENSNKDMAPIVDAIYEVRSETGAACLLVHHQSKLPHDATKGQGGIRARGASVIFADTDACWTIEPPDNPGAEGSETFQMFTEARWCEKPDSLLVWRKPDFTHEVARMGAADAAKQQVRRDQKATLLRDLLVREGHALTPTALGERAGISASTIRKIVREHPTLFDITTSPFDSRATAIGVKGTPQGRGDSMDP